MWNFLLSLLLSLRYVFISKTKKRARAEFLRLLFLLCEEKKIFFFFVARIEKRWKKCQGNITGSNKSRKTTRNMRWVLFFLLKKTGRLKFPPSKKIHIHQGDGQYIYVSSTVIDLSKKTNRIKKKTGKFIIFYSIDHPFVFSS